jgi:hypothetical protein
LGYPATAAPHLHPDLSYPGIADPYTAVAGPSL